MEGIQLKSGWGIEREENLEAEASRNAKGR